MERGIQEENVDYGVSMSSPRWHRLGQAQCPSNVSIIHFVCKITFKQY